MCCCSLCSNISTINSAIDDFCYTLGVLITLLQNLFGEEDTPSHNLTLLQSQFGYLMDTLVQVGHILEYVALISGFCLFLQNVREKMTMIQLSV